MEDYTNFDETADTVSGSVKVIAEPGRFFAQSSHIMICKVIAHRKLIGEVRSKDLDVPQ